MSKHETTHEPGGEVRRGVGGRRPSAQECAQVGDWGGYGLDMYVCGLDGLPSCAVFSVWSHRCSAPPTFSGLTALGLVLLGSPSRTRECVSRDTPAQATLTLPFAVELCTPCALETLCTHGVHCVTPPIHVDHRYERGASSSWAARESESGTARDSTPRGWR